MYMVSAVKSVARVPSGRRYSGIRVGSNIDLHKRMVGSDKERSRGLE